MSNALANESQPVTWSEYLAILAATEPVTHGTGWRYELDDGCLVISNMTSPTLAHDVIVSNLLYVFTGALRRAGRADCVVVANHAVRTRATQAWQPDVVVQCQPQPGPGRVLEQPCLIVEVASDSTQRTDQECTAKERKLHDYLAAPSVDAVLYVDVHDQAVTVYDRDSNGLERTRRVSGTQSVDLRCPEVTLRAADVFLNVPG